MATAYAVHDQVKPREATVFPVLADQLPVVILNMFYSGLGIARDLAGKSIRVIGLSADRKIYGNFTRCCEVKMAPNSQEEPDQLAEFLLKLSSELSGAVIFPTRDADVLFLDRFRDELSPYYRLSIPPHDCLLRVMNKHTLAIIAERSGIPVPRTTLVSSRDDLRRVDSAIGFPCVLKPVLAATWRGAENWNKVGARKAIRVDSLRELEREYQTLASVDPELLVQQWIPGSADQIVVLGGYVGCGGELLEYFTARKRIQSPNDFGTGCLVESEEIPEIVALSRRLCKSLGYEGMAEIEYKHDQASDTFRLIEINTRHWDWHRLGTASGINLSWTAFCNLMGREVEPGSKHTVSAKWIAEDALLTYLVRGLYRRQISFRDVLGQLAGPRVYGVFAWNDPGPWVRYFLRSFLPELAKSVFNYAGGGRS